MKLRLLLLGLLITSSVLLHAQDPTANKMGTLTGDFETLTNFFVRDSVIGAANTPQYDRQKFGTSNWLTLNYNIMGFDIGVRFDAYYNSNLIDPLDSYSALGLGRWHIRKKIHNLDITGGYFYDQIGNGTIFRAYNARYLPIDNALVGARLIYHINDNWQVKAFVGQQKKVEKQLNLFENYQPIIAGAAIDGFIAMGEGDKQVTLSPGAGAVRRTLDDESMNQVVNDISSYQPQDVFVPKYTTYAFSVYNTLTWGGINWFVEGAYKTAEAVNAFNTRGVLENRPGYNVYTSLSYSRKGFSILGQYKRTDHFILRTSPLQTLTEGMIAYLPPMARQNTYRLTARYNAATQEVGEEAVQLDLTWVPIPKKLTFNINFSNIMALDSLKTGPSAAEDPAQEPKLLYREINGNALWKINKKVKLIAGVQFQQYNQDRYEQKPGVPLLVAITPYAEMRFRFKKRRSLRIELSYMQTEQDFGSWAFALAEFSAKNLTFWASTMVNTMPTKYDNIEVFYEFGANYTHHSNRFEIAYKRQVEGIVCTGGVCRYQPAFNGVQLNVVSSF
jgi:hypothetical protein